MNIDKKIGITLSGGGARGIAHIGVLKALEEHYIFPHIISGASAGSIVGAMYAAGVSPMKMLEFAKKGSLLKTFQLSYPSGGLTDLEYLKKQLAKYIEHDSFEQLKKPLYISVCNLNKGAAEMLSSGPLFDAVKASSSIPMVFKPTVINKQTYIDGGLMNNFPTECIREHCDLLIGVNVMPHLDLTDQTFTGFLDILLRTFELSVWSNTYHNIERCDFFIEPKALSKYHIFNFSKAQDIFDIGYNSTMEIIPDILKCIL